MSATPAEQAPATAAGALPSASRRLIAAGVISPRVTVRITAAGVTGTIRKGATR
ncbi:hypothetical protein ACIRL0_00475 [Streptomyces sp. NPDC102365]|uniref:hypothetical protein n=1 Tax=Streptomyces sp. NPDC102365 TaxID=3366162 RepID=UPI0037FBE47F